MSDAEIISGGKFEGCPVAAIPDDDLRDLAVRRFHITPEERRSIFNELRRRRNLAAKPRATRRRISGELQGWM